MAVFNDVLTTEGQRFLMKMLSGETKNIKFTKLVLGDGTTSDDLKSITSPIHPVAEVQIDSVTLSGQNDVTITAVFRNTDITEGFYMREKALFATDGTNEVLVLYSNAGSLAEYIEPSSSEVYEKILRSVLVFSQNDNVNITVDDAGYTSIVDFHAHLEDYNNPHKVTKEQVGLGNIENKTINNQTPTFIERSDLIELSSGDTLSDMFGKIAKAIKDFISHISIVANSTVLGHIKIGTGLSMSNGVASVKLTNSLTEDDATKALTAKGAKALYDNLNQRLKFIAVNKSYTISYIDNTKVTCSEIATYKPILIVLAGVFMNVPSSAQQHLVMASQIGSKVIFHHQLSSNQEASFTLEINFTTGEISCTERYDSGIMQHLQLSVVGFITV